MAADAGAASGPGARSSTAALEASLDRRFQGVSNTMESIQGLSAWCIENKKHHGQIVRSWMKWLKKSDNNHRLNLFYVANDVIQNCKRKNAIVFRSSFADILPNATQFIRDGKVRKSVERIFTIWEERSVYPEETIAQLKASLNKREKEKEKEKQKVKEKDKEKEKKPPSTSAPSTTTKAALKSKILAEFTPQSLIEDLSRYKQAVAEEQFREKQLSTLRVDVCSTEALKRLKDKAGGNKFAKDFDEGSLKLQEFVSFLDKEMKKGPPLLESLGNADIFYEMQYKEVKIVANAYSAFASRVASLKRKLDSLKATLPGAEDSPIPSPSEDAPSPTGSDSPYLALGLNRAQVDPELDGKAMDESNEPQEDDMDVSDEEAEAATAGAEIKKDKLPAVHAAKVPTTPTNASKSNASAAAATTTVTPTSANAPANPLGVNLAKVDLGKISSILNSLTSAMKSTSSPALKTTPGTPSTPSGQSSALKTSSPSPALASILSRVDITPEGILNALSKSNTPGLSSLLHSVTNSTSAPASRTSPKSSGKTPVTPTTPKMKAAFGSTIKREIPGRSKDRDRERQLSPPPPPPTRTTAPNVSTPSLESKINSFLQGNPGFSLALGDLSPDGIDGTPVRDEAACTPTQDEMMDTPGSVPESIGSSGSHPLSPTAYRSDPWDAVITPSGSNSEGDLLSPSRFGAVKKSNTKLKEEEVRTHAVSSHSSIEVLKGKNNGQSGYLKSKAVAERRVSAGSRKVSSGSDEGGFSGKKEGKARGGTPGGDGKEGKYHRIETLVSPCTEGPPIEILGYSNRPFTGEPIKTVESIRVIDRGTRRGSSGGSRAAGGMWYEEEEYMEAQPPSPISVAPSLNIKRRNSEDMAPPLQLPLPPPPPPHPFLHLHPPPSPSHPPPSHPHHLPPPRPQFSVSYPNEAPPTHLHQHPALTSPFFNSPLPISRQAPPPLPQRPPTPPLLSPVPSAVMVGGVLVPVDRHLPLSLPVRPEGPERGAPRMGKVGPPFMTSLLGEPPRLPRPGTVREHFGPRSVLPLHRPGSRGVPPPLLGRVNDSANLSRPLPSPPSASTSPPPDLPEVDTAPPCPPSTTKSALPPEQKTPEPKTPELKLPGPKFPESKLPEPKTPELKLPEPKTPEPKLPEPKLPEPKLPEPKLPEPKLPGPKLPEPKLPEPKLLEAKKLEPKLPEPKTPEPKVLEQKGPELKAPQLRGQVQRGPEQRGPQQRGLELKAPVSSPTPPRPRAPAPGPLLDLARPLFMTEPIPQRPLVRGRPPPPPPRPPGFRGFRGKRHGPPFGGPFYPPKRPFLPPRY